MPHAAMMIVHANELLGDRDELIGIGSRLAAARTLADGAEVLGLLDAVDPDHRDEAAKAIAAIPPSVGAAMLAAIRSAADREIPVVVQWKPGPAVELQLWEAVEDGVGLVGILLVSPRARDLARAQTASRA